MSKLPYPGFNPSFKNVRKRNGLHRNIFIVEVLSKKPISPMTKALISEQTEAKIDQLLGKNGLIDFDVVSDDRFDVLLQQGLRFTADGY